MHYLMCQGAAPLHWYRRASTLRRRRRRAPFATQSSPNGVLVPPRSNRQQGDGATRGLKEREWVAPLERRTERDPNSGTAAPVSRWLARQEVAPLSARPMTEHVEATATQSAAVRPRWISERSGKHECIPIQRTSVIIQPAPSQCRTAENWLLMKSNKRAIGGPFNCSPC